MLEDNKFNFFVPLDEDFIEKASKKKGEDRYKEMFLSGVASDSSVDAENETLEPKGYNLERFKKYGTINYDHKSRTNPKFIIGEPIESKVVNNKFIIKAKLYSHSPLARDVFDTILMLKASGSTRKLGWSVEGVATERDLQNPKRVTKALITGCAITPSPVNANSYADIVKGIQKNNFQDYQYEVDELSKSNEAANRGQITYLVDITNHETGIRYTIDKNLHLKVEKAMSTETAKPLIREDLERKLKVLPFGDVKAALVNVSKANRDGKIKKSLFDEIKRNIDIYKKYI